MSATDRIAKHIPQPGFRSIGNATDSTGSWLVEGEEGQMDSVDKTYRY